jgi:hypothetical protein
LWIRVDSAGYQQQVIEAAERHRADFTVTVKGYPTVTAVVHALAGDPDTVWTPALGAETDKGSEIAETTAVLLGRTRRLIVRRQPGRAGDQLALDGRDGWRLHAIITNVPAGRMSAAEVEAHHRLRGGIPEDTIRALKNDFGMIHAPVQPFFGNWLYWLAAALAHNVALWLRTLALPRAFRRARGKRLRLAFLNVAARLVRHGRRLHLRFPAAYTHPHAFIAPSTGSRRYPHSVDPTHIPEADHAEHPRRHTRPHTPINARPRRSKLDTPTLGSRWPPVNSPGAPRHTQFDQEFRTTNGRLQIRV